MQDPPSVPDGLPAKPVDRSVLLEPGTIAYPGRLYDLERPPIVRASGPLELGRAVAIVGSRKGNEGSRGLAFSLAYHLARAGVTVVSGGAIGVDRCAHEGALHAGGVTWLVSPTGRGKIFPAENEDLFRTIEASEHSRVLWPFADRTPKTIHTPRARNRVLVALAECVVVIQAAIKSGSLNAAACARSLGRHVWIVPGAPNDPDFHGSVQLGVGGGRVFWSIEAFFHALELPPPHIHDLNAGYRGKMPLSTRIPRRPQLLLTYGNPSAAEADHNGWSAAEKSVFSVLSRAPLQQDTIIDRAGLSASSTLTALLTLSLKDVVVEGPDGFFRRRVSS